MLCHSYLYQPNLTNKLLSGLEIGKEIALRGVVAMRAARAAHARYRQQRN